MNKRRIELQLRLILVAYRMEKGRLSTSALRDFRERARSIIRSLESAARPDPELRQALAEALREIDADPTTRADRLAR